MARWKLTESHYLAVPETSWEYSEIDRRTGRPKRTKFPVPLFLDPKSIDDLRSYGQNNPENPSVDPEDWIMVVTNVKHPQNAKDIYFEGTPTPGMFPLDDEAKAITEKHSSGMWSPTKGLNPEAQNESFTSQLVAGLIDKMTEAKAAAEGAAPAQGMQQFMDTMAAMMKQQTDIITMLAKGQVEAKAERRKVA